MHRSVDILRYRLEVEQLAQGCDLRTTHRELPHSDAVA